jgi:hypothetical protein
VSEQEPKKKLMPELLPRPVSFQGTAARARVISHLRVLAATGAATLTLAACPFITVDPLPPPPKCRTTRGVAADLVGSVSVGSNLPNDAGTLADGGMRDTYTLLLDDSSFGNSGSGAVALTALISTTNTNRAVIGSNSSTPINVYFEPTDPSQPVELRFATSCEGSSAVVLKAVLTPSGTGAWNVALSDVP